MSSLDDVEFRWQLAAESARCSGDSYEPPEEAGEDARWLVDLARAGEGLLGALDAWDATGRSADLATAAAQDAELDATVEEARGRLRMLLERGPEGGADPDPRWLPRPREMFRVAGEEMRLLEYCDEPNTGLARIESRGFEFTVPVSLLRAAIGVPTKGEETP